MAVLKEFIIIIIIQCNRMSLIAFVVSLLVVAEV
jgi:hypothetical protein